MASFHARSNSFPSIQHPLIVEFDEQLSRLRSSLEASSSSNSVSSNLNGLQDLHDCVDQLLLLPLNQQALTKEHNAKSVDLLLDGSLRILDVCSATKDALTQTKESTQEILSILRRRCCGDLTSEVKKFLASKKIVKKALNKTIAKSHNSSPVKESAGILSILSGVESITLAVFESLFTFISGPKSQKSLLSKLISSKRVVCEDVNEFESVESALNMLIGPKAKNSDNKVREIMALTELQKLEMCIQDMEEGVESLYRRLIKTRVSLLNTLNH